MTVAVEQEKEMAEFGSESNNVNPSDYSCQVLLERTCLLYTSPSPRDQRGSRMPSSA